MFGVKHADGPEDVFFKHLMQPKYKTWQHFWRSLRGKNKRKSFVQTTPTRRSAFLFVTHINDKTLAGFTRNSVV
jgi:hypothetical protein